MTRGAAIAAFLAAAGWGRAARTALAGDASPRRYERLAMGGATAVLMDAPPERGVDVRPFLAVTAWLRGAGLSAPAVLARDAGRGLVLLEDLGDALFARRLERHPGDERLLYGAACDLLAALQALPPPAVGPDWSPRAYDAALLAREASLALEWYLPAAAGRAADAEETATLAMLIETLARPLAASRPVAVLRDYHAENLVWLPARRGAARVGLLDHQDMVIGHPAYDVVSLLADARRDTGPTLRAAMRARYLRATGADPAEFGYAAAFLSAQRNLKILGIFTRLCRRDGKPLYLRHLARVWTNLQIDLAHPDLASLAAFAARLPAPEASILARIEAAA